MMARLLKKWKWIWISQWDSSSSINNLVEKDETGAFRIKLDIQKGYMGFKVQKNKGHDVNFSTGTAAASIRGTEGVIGGNDKAMFAGLKNGQLSVSLNNGDSLYVGEGETVFGKGEFVVLKLKSSGDLDFAKIVNKIIADSTLSLDELLAAVVSADDALVEWKQDGKTKSSLDTLKEGCQQIIKSFKDSSKDIAGADTIEVCYSTAAPVVDVFAPKTKVTCDGCERSSCNYKL